MPSDLVVIGQDPRFGGGGLAQTEAFLTAAKELGRDASFLFDPHPGLGRPRTTWRRVEALRQLAAARRLAADATAARSLWVVATLAHNGAAAPHTGRRYGCWIGTTIDSEWQGRAEGLPVARRIAAGISIRRLRAIERRVLSGAARVYATARRLAPKSPSARVDRTCGSCRFRSSSNDSSLHPTKIGVAPSSARC